MPVKHWSYAGLILTYRCDARCACCYFSCGPDRDEEMTVETAMAVWDGLASASPHGCRIHLTGGEPYLDWPRLTEICRRAKAAGLSTPGGRGPLEKVETNASWAVNERDARDRLAALDDAGMAKLAISADPYHQQFVPIDRCRLLARVAEEVLGASRVQVRWRDWLAEGFDTAGLPEDTLAQVFARHAALGRERWNGRAATKLAGMIAGAGGPALKCAAEFADSPCKEALLRSRHVHVDGLGRVIPGTCAGIVLGRLAVSEAGQGLARNGAVKELWERLRDDHASRPIVGVLAAAGPVGLLETAMKAGFRPAPGYLSKCHLCWDIRRRLAGQGLCCRELGPGWMYR
ncbi:MAG: radical SAM protein [Phycisphaerae bacterium]